MDWPPWSMIPVADRPALGAEPGDVEQAVRDLDEAGKFCEMLRDELRQQAVRDRDDLAFARQYAEHLEALLKRAQVNRDVLLTSWRKARGEYDT